MFFFFVLFFLVSGVLTPPLQVRAQQAYGKEIDDCTNPHNSSSMLGYFCNTSSPPSCQSFLTFTSMAPYSNLSSIASLLGTSASTLAAANDLAAGDSAAVPEGTTVLVPATCGCTSTPEGRFYQHNATANSYVVIAKGAFQGLTTCQALEAQALHGAPPESLLAGEVLPGVVPLRCACPSAAQAAGGVRFLVSYVVAESDDVSQVAARFGVDAGDVIAANELQSPYTIFPSTTLLIPVASQPNASRIQTPPPPPPSPPVVVSSPAPGKKGSNHVGIYIGVAVAAFSVAAIASAAAFLALNSRRKRRLAGVAVLAAGELPKKEGRGKVNDTSTDMTSSAFFTGDGGEFSLSTSEAFTSISVADIKSSLRVYTYAELKSATDGFSHGHHIGGSVYRAEFAGDVAAVEVVDDRNVSAEVEILRKINHLNLIRLVGLCHHHGRWFLVTEFADHGSLRDRLLLSGEGSPAALLTWPERMQVALDVAEGLRYLHEYARPKCVHMDVSSGSVLLAGGEGAHHLRGKLRSFGAARVITGAGEDGEEEVMYTMTSRIAGTRGYMAPEYLEHGVVSPKADVYSLGVVMLELLTGKVAEELVGDGVGDPFVALRELADELDGGGDAVLQRLEELVDPAMPAGSCTVDGVVMMVRLIERCVRREAAARPTAGEVARRLLKMSGVEVVRWGSSPESPRSPGR
nr:unnamed protein product [Digitaria exilis]